MPAIDSDTLTTASGPLDGMSCEFLDSAVGGHGFATIRRALPALLSDP